MNRFEKIALEEELNFCRKMEKRCWDMADRPKPWWKLWSTHTRKTAGYVEMANFFQRRGDQAEFKLRTEQSLFEEA